MALKKYVYSVLACLCLWLASAQVLLPTYETAFEKQHTFHSAVIKKHGIKRITFDIIDKKDFEIAIDKNLTEVYEFNDSALLSRYYYTDIVSASEKEYFTKPVYRRRRLIKPAMRYTKTEYTFDTVSVSYLYNAQKKLLVKRITDRSGIYQSYYYTYNQHGQLVRENRIRETNGSSDKSVFTVGNQVIISTDSFQFQVLNATQTKQLFYNNENRVYKERILIKEDSVNITEIRENYVAAWLIQKHIFTYQNGKLMRAVFTGNANGEVTLAREYTYDAQEELLTEKRFKNGVQTHEMSYITDASSQLLSSFISRDLVAKTIRIVKLKYDFWHLPQEFNTGK